MYQGGAVIIGRNEGERLKRCLQSVLPYTEHIVYVDSGSSDGSADYARSLGIGVVELDSQFPFSAARARNEGFDYLVKRFPDLRCIQFVDGDCEMEGDWLTYAEMFLLENPDCAIVAGKVAERDPQRSIYHRLCDMEWQVPHGEVLACGGIFCVKTEAFLEVGGFVTQVVAGEEPELCYRLRQRKRKIVRTAHPMVLHDAEITRFGQWWKRAERSGYAYAQGMLLHGLETERYCVRETVGIWFWSIFFLLTSTGAAIASPKAAIMALLLYFAQFLRISWKKYRDIRVFTYSLAYAYFVLLGKWPQLVGQLRCFFNFSQRRHAIIEYK